MSKVKHMCERMYVHMYACYYCKVISACAYPKKIVKTTRKSKCGIKAEKTNYMCLYMLRNILEHIDIIGARSSLSMFLLLNYLMFR